MTPPRTRQGLWAAPFVAALLAACTAGGGDLVGPTPTGAPSIAEGEFAIAVPPGWESVDDDDQGIMWVSPPHDDGTRLGVLIDSGCLTDAFDAFTDELQSPEGNWRGYGLLAGPDPVEVPGAAQAERWQAEYLLAAPGGDGDARLLSTEVFAVAADGSSYHVQFEGRDTWYDQDLADQVVGSLRVSGFGCG